jgi:starch-binding outer membrane protein, SusD/RagB family
MIMRNHWIKRTSHEDMMNVTQDGRLRPTVPSRRLGRFVGVLLVGISMAACDSLLDVDVPDRVDAEDLSNPDNAGFLVTGAIADFECALGAYIVNQGMLGNELRDASVTAARFSLDRRDFTAISPYGTNSCTGNPPGIYRPLSTARWSADNAITQLDGWTDAQVAGRTRMIAQAAAYSGYSHVLMGEGFCTLVIEELGPEVQPSAAFEAAISRFTRAIETARTVGDSETENLALLGRARAYLNLGNMSQAAADARAVLSNDPTFEVIATTSTASSRRWNRVGDEFWGGRITVDPLYRDLAVGGEPDPRVIVVDTETVGHDNTTPVWLAQKVGPARVAGLREQPLPVATWREAHLIIAEVEGGAEAVTRINILRDHWDLPHFSSDDPAEIAAQVLEERSRELFLEGQHLSDLRRHNLPFLPATGEAYRQGGAYGNQTCFPLPDVERNNNPNVPNL